MQDTRKKFGCPECQKTVKVPVKYLGKRIKCPKCSFVFRAGPKQPKESEIYAELDDDFEAPDAFPVAGFADPMPAYQNAAPMPGVQPPPLAPMATPQPLPQSRPATPYRSTLPKKPRKRDQEMTETDNYLQSSGIFLIVLPVIATVLPLFGLQLRRLAKLGEFAPLAAMFLGLIGVGMICYARRKQGDAPLLGSAAAVFVLVSGIGGFFLVSSLAGDADGGGVRYSDQSVEDYNTNVAKEAMARAEESREQMERESEARRQSMRNRMGQESQQMREMQEQADQMMRQAQQDHQRAMDSMRVPGGNFPGPPNIPTPNFPTNPPNIPTPNFGSDFPSGGGFGRRRN